MNPAGGGFAGFSFGSTPTYGATAASSAAPATATPAAPTFGSGSAFPTFGKFILIYVR